MMPIETELQPVHRVWVDWVRRIVSFHEVEGFQVLVYPTHEEMFAFVIEKGFAGFGIQ